MCQHHEHRYTMFFKAGSKPLPGADKDGFSKICINARSLTEAVARLEKTIMDKVVSTWQAYKAAVEEMDNFQDKKEEDALYDKQDQMIMRKEEERLAVEAKQAREAKELEARARELAGHMSSHPGCGEDCPLWNCIGKDNQEQKGESDSERSKRLESNYNQAKFDFFASQGKESEIIRVGRVAPQDLKDQTDELWDKMNQAATALNDQAEKTTQPGMTIGELIKLKLAEKALPVTDQSQLMKLEEAAKAAAEDYTQLWQQQKDLRTKTEQAGVVWSKATKKHKSCQAFMKSYPETESKSSEGRTFLQKELKSLSEDKNVAWTEYRQLQLQQDDLRKKADRAATVKFLTAKAVKDLKAKMAQKAKMAKKAEQQELEATQEWQAKQKGSRARLDADKTAKPLTRLVARLHTTDAQGHCLTAMADTYEDLETGVRIPLG